ncbi:MAG: hypothetical protein M1490_03250 [Candidatus Bathyarchaeota archaeon]|nr:hypothetical protein [Candidatus Bathyarchaeota archaeon]
MRIIIDHPMFRLTETEEDTDDDGLLWDKIETYLRSNNIKYAAISEDEEIGLNDGIIVWLPDLSPREHYYEKKEQHIKQVQDFSRFLFDELKLSKMCLHFINIEECVNGEGNFEQVWNAIDEVTYGELTGLTLPKQFGSQNISAHELKK